MTRDRLIWESDDVPCKMPKEGTTAGIKQEMVYYWETSHYVTDYWAVNWRGGYIS